MSVVEHILDTLSYHEYKHPVGTVMRMADVPLNFTPRFKFE